MEVLLLTAPPGIGGVQRYSDALYKNMKNNDNNVNITKPKIKNFPFIGAALSMPFQTITMDAGSYDIVHNTTWYPVLLPRRGKSINISTAFEFQEIIHYPVLDTMPRRSLKERIWSRVAIETAEKAVLNSDYMLAISTQTVNEAIKLGVAKEKIFLVHVGIERRFVDTVISANKKEKEFKVGYLGALSSRKNISLVVNAFKYLDSKKYSLDLWGKSYGLDALTAKFITSHSNIKLNGVAKERDILNIYDSFNVFVFPSFYEGFGLPIIEAQARGLPVIIYKKGIITKEVRRYCFEAENAEHMAQLIEHIKNNGYNEKKRKMVMKYARGFTWEKTARETLKIYRRVLNK